MAATAVTAAARRAKLDIFEGLSQRLDGGPIRATISVGATPAQPGDTVARATYANYVGADNGVILLCGIGIVIPRREVIDAKHHDVRIETIHGWIIGDDVCNRKLHPGTTTETGATDVSNQQV